MILSSLFCLAFSKYMDFVSMVSTNNFESDFSWMFLQSEQVLWFFFVNSNYLFYKNFVTIQDSYFRKWLLDPMSKDNVWVKIKLSYNYLCQMSQLLFVMPLKRKFEIFFASVMNCKGNFRQATPYQKTKLKAQNLLSIRV